MDKQVNEFCYKYDAIVGPSHRMHRRSKRIDYKTWSESDPSIFNSIPFEDIKCVEVHMPEDRFRALLEHDSWIEQAGLHDNRHFTNNVGRVANMVVEYEREVLLRNQYPTLKKAWEKYQMILRMCET